MTRLKQTISDVLYFTLAYFSRLANVLIFRGNMHDTLSERSYVESVFNGSWEKRRRFIDGLFFWEEDHCETVWRAEVERAKATLARAEVIEKLTGEQTYEADE